MWNKIQYALIYSWVKIHAFLPMWALYILSDILYILIYKVVRYRVKVVRQNMKASFPDKSETELRQLEREFYHHFADYVVETIKLAHISLEELQRRAYLKNPELVDKLMEKGHTCFILLMGHSGHSATRLSTACSSTYVQNSVPSESKNRIPCAMLSL